MIESPVVAVAYCFGIVALYGFGAYVLLRLNRWCNRKLDQWFGPLER